MTPLKAVRIRSFGGPEVLELTDLEKPEPQDDEVLIRVQAASINPVDYKSRSGTYPAVKQDQAQLERHHSQGKVVLQIG